MEPLSEGTGLKGRLGLEETMKETERRRTPPGRSQEDLHNKHQIHSLVSSGSLWEFHSLPSDSCKKSFLEASNGLIWGFLASLDELAIVNLFVSIVIPVMGLIVHQDILSTLSAK